MKKPFGDSSEQLKERLRRIVKKPTGLLAAEIALLASVVLIVCLLLIGTLQPPDQPQQPDAVQLEKIEITAMPYRCIYVTGQQLDTAGMALTLTYSDGTTEKITEGITCSPQVLEVCGKQRITVTSGDQVATFEVDVVEPVLSGSCGASLSWDLTADGVLIISGSGRMDDFTGDKAPWSGLRYTIKTVYLPEGLQNIGDSAFIFCYKLAEIRIPESVSSIGKDAFQGCGSLQSCRITGKVRDIELRAFYNCSSLQEVVLPQELAYISPLAFAHCEKLQSISLPDSLTTIGHSAFSNTGLRQITIPDGVTHIPYSMFFSCTDLERVDLPASITSIAEGAFYNCTALKSLQIPAGMRSLHSGIFRETGIERFTVAPDSPYFVADDKGVVYTKGFEKLVAYPVARKGSYSVAENCTVIGTYAFDTCKGLTDITLPDTLQEIEEYAFFCCDGLQRIVIPKSVKVLGDRCFDRCSGLTELYIMNGACHIHGYILCDMKATVIYSHAGSAVLEFAWRQGYRYSVLPE